MGILDYGIRDLLADLGDLGFCCFGCLWYLCTLYVLVLHCLSLKCDLCFVFCILDLGVLGFLISWICVVLSYCSLCFVFCVLECCLSDARGLNFGFCGLVFSVVEMLSLVF